MQFTCGTTAWLFLITLMNQRDNTGDRGKIRLTRERVPLGFFFIFTRRFVADVLHVLLFMHGLFQSLFTFF